MVPRKPADQTVSREEILVAAAHVFHERGYHGATMQDISAAVGLTAGSLYHHFKGGKEALLIAVLQDGLERVTADVREIADSDRPPDEKLHCAVKAHVASVTRYISVAAVMIFEMRTTLSMPDVPQVYLEQRDQFEGLYRQMIREGIDAGIFRTVDIGIFTRAVMGSSNWVSVWFNPNGRLSGSEIGDEIADIFLNSLLKAKS